ncbi:MAG: MinD/ParA family protein [Pseudomonadales bacterium]|nr:MinD/ParA family protein [Pseudomonadales bacterium]
MHPIQVIAVTGGKGGVGKTNISVNLGLALTEMGKRVILLDADLGLANVDILLGLKPDKNIADVVAGKCELRDIMLTTSSGLKVMPASSGVHSLTSLGARQHAGIINAFSTLADELDILLIDTAAGISDSVISFVRAAQEVLLVVCDEPSSITDAYALVKLLNRDFNVQRFRVIANMARTSGEGVRLFNKFMHVTDRFLDVNLQYAGEIPFDDTVRKATQRQKPVLEAYPGGKAAQAYRKLAKECLQWPIEQQANGQLEFFVERLVAASAG